MLVLVQFALFALKKSTANPTKCQVYDYVFVPEKGDKGEWVPWMSTTEKYCVDPKLQFNEVLFVHKRIGACDLKWQARDDGVNPAQYTKRR